MLKLSPYYRKDLFRQAGLDPENPPGTWEQLANDANKITKAAKGAAYGIALSTSLDYYTVQNFMSAYLGYGARMIGENGKCGFNTPEFKAALTVYVSMYKNHSTHPDAPSMNGDTFRRGFRDGKYAMILADPGLYGDLKSDNASFFKDIGIAMVPAGPKGRAGFLEAGRWFFGKPPSTRRMRLNGLCSSRTATLCGVWPPRPILFRAQYRLL